MYKGKFPKRVRSVSYRADTGLYVQTNDRNWFYTRTKDIPKGSTLPKLGEDCPEWAMQNPQQ